MVIFAAALLSAVIARAETKPTPIGVGEREEAHVGQKSVLATQLEVLRLRDQPTIETARLRLAEIQAAEAVAAWQKLLDALRAKHGANAACFLDERLRWICK
jgi:hypothetical protein